MAGGTRLRAAVLLSVFVRVLSGLAVKCTVSHDGGRSTYTLQNGFYGKDAQNPEFSWFNMSNHVLANHVGQVDVVIKSSFNALTARACIETLFYQGHINSKGNPLDYTANCTTVCPPEALTGNQGMSHYWIAIIVIVSLLLVSGMCFLCCKYEYLRRCRCGQTRGLYTIGKNEEPKTEDV